MKEARKELESSIAASLVNFASGAQLDVRYGRPIGRNVLVV